MRKNILSVNGNIAMNYLLQTVCEEEYHFTPVADVFEGLMLLQGSKKYNVLIVDVDYQTEQSWGLIQHIKSSKLHRVPVIVLTTENNENVSKKSIELGIDEVFFKPFNPVDLIAAIKSITDLYVNA